MSKFLKRRTYGKKNKHLLSQERCKCTAQYNDPDCFPAKKECKHKYVGSDNFPGKPCYYCGQPTEPVGEEVKEFDWMSKIREMARMAGYEPNAWYQIRVEQFIKELLESELHRQKKLFIKKVKWLKKESDFQDFGWSDVGDWCDECLEELEEKE